MSSPTEFGEEELLLPKWIVERGPDILRIFTFVSVLCSVNSVDLPMACETKDPILLAIDLMLLSQQ